MKKVLPFLKYRFIAFGVSISFVVVFTIGTVASGGLNMGVDFVGGVKVIAKFDKEINEGNIRNALNEFNPMVQQIGQDNDNEYIITTKIINKQVKQGNNKSSDIVKESPAVANGEPNVSQPVTTGVQTGGTNEIQHDQYEENIVVQRLRQNFSTVEISSIEEVGSTIGDYLRESAIQLFLVAMVLMTIYLSFRFEFNFSLGAMIALVHDILITILFCGFVGVEINVPVIAALLTIFGYSVNDSIVIFDRIRENLQDKSKQTFDLVINRSISQSISRTLLTSLTTLFAVSALYVLGGEGLNDFALVLLFGIFIGTYSSMYVAAPFMLMWNRVVKK